MRRIGILQGYMEMEFWLGLLEFRAGLYGL